VLASSRLRAEMFAESTDEERMWRVEMIERRGEEG
jgi:hypothetical protein